MEILVRFGRHYHPAGTSEVVFTPEDVGKTFRGTITLNGGLFQGNTVTRELRVEDVDQTNDAVYTVINAL